MHIAMFLVSYNDIIPICKQNNTNGQQWGNRFNVMKSSWIQTSSRLALAVDNSVHSLCKYTPRLVTSDLVKIILCMLQRNFSSECIMFISLKRSLGFYQLQSKYRFQISVK